MLYFDYAATTPADPRVVQAMEPYFSDSFWNASALYAGGRQARAAVEQARAQVARLLGAQPGEVFFTSGGTEADNTAVVGAALAMKERGRTRVAVSAIEHHAVLESAEFLQRFGFTVTQLPVDRCGRVAPATLQKAMGPDVALVSVMWVNNELGTVQDIPALAAIAHAGGALFHTDAVQALSTQDVHFARCGADLMTVSSHKIYGPKGCGALVVRTGVTIEPLLHGGQQEHRMRGGTENVAAIVGFGRAAELLAASRAEDARTLAAHKQAMLALLTRPGITVNSPPDCTAPSVLNIALHGVEAEGMLFHLGRAGFCVSMGSACNSESVEPSHVIRAIGLAPADARGCIRISFGHGQTDADCAALAAKILELAAQLRE